MHVVLFLLSNIFWIETDSFMIGMDNDNINSLIKTISNICFYSASNKKGSMQTNNQLVFMHFSFTCRPLCTHAISNRKITPNKK